MNPKTYMSAATPVGGCIFDDHAAGSHCAEPARGEQEDVRRGLGRSMSVTLNILPSAAEGTTLEQRRIACSES
jgi:hypothetical protein